MNARVTVPELYERNKEYAETTHTPVPTLTQMGAKFPKQPWLHTIIIACLDGRADPEKILKLQRGGLQLSLSAVPASELISIAEATVIRNVGGRTANTIGDILVIDALFDPQDIVVLHHTDCGLEYVTDDGVRDVAKEQLGDNGQLAKLEIGAFTDVDQSVRDDVTFLRNSPLIRKGLASNVVGMVYDLHTGLLRKIDI